MNLVHTFEFTVISILDLFTIIQTMSLIYGTKEYRRKYVTVFLMYLISGIICSWYRNHDKPVIFLTATICYYAFLLICILSIFKSKKLWSVYISVIVLILDSIFQSIGCILIDLFVQDFDRATVLNFSSMIFNIVVLILLRFLQKNHQNQIRNSIRLLPKRLYILILIVLVFIGELCGNMAVESSELFFDNKINSFLTVLTIMAFLTIIISFVFSSISRQYYESILGIMEKQMVGQVEHYQKINKLTDDLREFRHDYKNHMICLQATLEKRQLDEALDYVKSITKQEIIDANKFSSGNQIADSILSEKSESAANIGTQIQFSGFISDEIPAVDLCTMLSNALDNAIEACEKLSLTDSAVITVKCAVVQNVQVIKLSNPNPDNKNSTETSKLDKDNHGFGLYNIRRTVEKLGGEMRIPKQFPEFVLELEFPIK